MSHFPSAPELLTLVAERFKALAEPARLGILLHSLGFVERRKEGLYVYYRLADEEVFKLCDIMCGRLEREAHLRNRLLAGRLSSVRCARVARWPTSER